MPSVRPKRPLEPDGGSEEDNDGSIEDEGGSEEDEDGSVEDEGGSADEDGSIEDEDGNSEDEDGTSEDEYGEAEDEEGTTEDGGGAELDVVLRGWYDLELTGACELLPAFNGEGAEGCADPKIELRSPPDVLCFVAVSLVDSVRFPELSL